MLASTLSDPSLPFVLVQFHLLWQRSWRTWLPSFLSPSPVFLVCHLGVDIFPSLNWVPHSLAMLGGVHQRVATRIRQDPVMLEKLLPEALLECQLQVPSQESDGSEYP